MKKLFILYCLFNILACSTISGDSGSAGDQNLTAAPTEITFEANIATTTYHALTFANNSADYFVINNLALADNGCQAFSIFNIMDTSQNILYAPGDTLSVTLAPQTSANINIRFSPTTCSTTNYTATLVIYYLEGSTQRDASVLLTANVTDTSTEDDLVCSDEIVTYYDEFENPTERTLPLLPDGKKYYVEVYRARAYIQMTGGFASQSTAVGTDLDLEYMDEDNYFQPAYIGFASDDAGNLNIDTIDKCVGFNLPSATTHPFLVGASMDVTTAQTFSGTIDRTENIGRFTIPFVEWTLYSFINNSASLMQNEDGYFRANSQFVLTSGTSDYNAYLEDLTDDLDDEGEPFLNIQNGRLVGQDLRHGMMSVVGIGTFVETADALGSNETKQAIFENDAYMFLQLDCRVTQVEE